IGDQDLHGRRVYPEDIQSGGKPPHSKGAHCMMRAMPAEPIKDQRQQILSGVVDALLGDLKQGNGDRDRRRQVEEWMRTLAEKYPEFKIEVGLRDYYLAEAERLRGEFEKTTDLTERLSLGRNIESFLDRAADYEKRIGDR